MKESKILLTRKHVGQLDIANGFVDITDPCYDKDVWCRMNQVELMPGLYDCFIYAGALEDWGNRNWICQIAYSEDVETARMISEDLWEEIGEIGVDAGLAGFFADKPDYSQKEWIVVCDWMFGDGPHNPEGIPNVYLTRDGFWSESGCGDGDYEVFAIRYNGRITALEIRF